MSADGRFPQDLLGTRPPSHAGILPMVQMSSEESSLGHSADQASCGQRDSPPSPLPPPHTHPQETRALSEAQQVWCIQALPQPRDGGGRGGVGSSQAPLHGTRGPGQATPCGVAPATHTRRGQGEEKAPASPIFGCSRNHI